MKSSPDASSLEEVELWKEYRELSKVKPWLAYPMTAVPKIMPWHESQADYRVLSGPNGGGKTTAGAADFISYATGFNPIRHESYPTPNVCWAVCVEYQSAGRVIFRKLSEMLPRKKDGARDWKYYKQEHLIVLNKPYHSEIHIKSQNEGESSLLAERCTAIWIDEAKGGDTGEENFGELQARGLPDQPLKMLFTLTPKMDTGIDWMRRKLWCEPGSEPHEDFIPGTFCHRFELSDCLIEKGGFLTRAHLEQREATVDPDEREARLLGLWTPFMSRPAFKYSLLMKALARAPKSKHVQIYPGTYRTEMKEADHGPCKQQRDRESGHSYIAVWDPASGLGKGHDPSAFVVLDRGDLTQVFHANPNDIEPERFARTIAIPAARYYNDALLAVENNGEAGQAAVGALRDAYDNLYHQINYQKQSATYTDIIGWRTSDQSRGRVFDSLQRALREDRWTPSKDLLDEMSHITVKMSDSGRKRIEHADGFHDDLVLATGIALAIHYEEPVVEWPDLNKLRIKYGPVKMPVENLPFV